VCARGVQPPIDRFQRVAHILALKSVITRGFTHDISVFLFHETIIAFTVRPASGEPDVVQAAPVFELAVDELAAVVAVNARKGEGGLTNIPTGCLDSICLRKYRLTAIGLARF
jgi:hypothetical protein